jgi:hypothetical protein
VLVGEQLNPATYGPGIIETRRDIVGRLLSMPSPPDGDLGPASGTFAAGQWRVPGHRATYFPRGHRNVVNSWGDTSMGIGFPTRVFLEGAYFAGQAGEGVWTTAVRAVGYRAGVEIGATAWFHNIGDSPQWMQMSLHDIDRVVIESIPVNSGGGWYGMDDFTYAPLGENGNPGQKIVVNFEDAFHGQGLTGSNYAGLSWETGTGARNASAGADAMPAPLGTRRVTPPGDDDASRAAPRGGSGHPPIVTQSFQGALRGDAGSASFPPDTCGAIGPTQFVEVVNRVFAVYNKTTGLASTIVNLGAFQPGTSGDPRVVFDQYSGRWIVISSDFNSRIYLAVSATSDADGAWFKTDFIASQGNDAGCGPDYPTLGVDANGIYIGAFMAINCNHAAMTIFAIDKAPLVAPVQSLGTITAFRDLPIEGAIQPCHTIGAQGIPGEYLLSTVFPSSLRVRQITGPLTSPSASTVAVLSAPAYTDAADAPALGSSTPLDTVGSRLMNAVYRDGSMWAAHTINVLGRAGVRWYQIAESPTVNIAQSGTIADPVLWYYFPSLAVNATGHMVIGFTGSSAAQFASCYVSGRVIADPPGETAPPILFKAGLASQNNFDQFGRNRWGDYSLTSIDPVDDQTFWTIQEYGHATDIWGTYIAKVNYDDVDFLPPDPSPMTFTINPTPVSTTAIVMQAAETTDDTPPIQYFFDYFTGSGGHDSPWQTSRDYTDTGLLPNRPYNYRVKARDSAVMVHETGYSAVVNGATAIESPTTVAFGTVTQTSIQVSAPGTFTNLAAGTSGLFFEMTPDVPGSGANVWVQSTSINAVGLAPGTQYTFRIKARNRLSFETPFTSPADQSTVAPVQADCDGDASFNLDLDTACFIDVLIGVNTDPGSITRSDFTGDFLANGDDVPGFVDCALTGCP